MKKCTILFALLISVLFISSSAYAQFRLSLSPALGLNFNLHTGSDLPESGNGFGMMIGGYADMNFTENIGLIAGLAFYDNRSGSYSQTGTEQGVSYTADYSASLAYFQIESLFKLGVKRSNFFFVMGPVLGFNISSEGEQTIKITTPGYTFQDGSTSQKTKATIKDTQVRFELKAGAGYDIPVADGIAIAPQLTFGYGLTNVVSDVKWSILTIQAQVGVKINML
jgi:Outer membrane protein beta-barrel domain